jgi:uncharacterized protein (TIGR02145 family)
MKKIILFTLFIFGCNSEKNDELNLPDLIKSPIVETKEVVNITYNSVEAGGIIESNGGGEIIAQGICWGTNTNPDITGLHTNEAIGTSNYVSNISNLDDLGTTYYVRAYATNSNGTSYGSEKTFITPETGFMTDIDGNIYPTIKIGAQTWMQKNLNVSHYKNGAPITNIIDQTDWVNNSNFNNNSPGAYCYYNNDEANGNIYGKLYNLKCVLDTRGLAPEGWHVAGQGEWAVLQDYLGADSGGKMKSIDLWSSPNIGATNSSGFTALPAGTRTSVGFSGLGFGTEWYNGNQYYPPHTGPLYGYNFTLYNNTSNSFGLASEARNGLSIRCIKN